MMNRKVTLQSYQKRIKKVLAFIEAHVDEEIALEKLAEVACFSPYHFHRVFSGMVGESVKSYIRRLKLERAACQLLFTHQLVTEIAFTAGYDSLEAFTRAFQELFEKSPSRYREEERELRLTHILTFESEVINMQAEIRKVPKMKIACVRHVGPYLACEPAVKKLFSCKSIPYGPHTKFIGICYDDPAITEPEKIRYDACLTVPDDFQPTEGFEVREVGGGKYAVTRHPGSYENLSQTYGALIGKWIVQNGYELRPEPPFEIYINNLKDTKPQDLITEIYIPIK
jgi:AraC family transcriptional regulator